MDIQRIAEFDPVAALWLMRSGGTSRVPQLFPIVASFTDNSQPIGIDLPQVGQDLFVESLDYDVERPNAFAGSVFKAQSDLANAKSPFVDLRIKMRGGSVIYILGDDARIQTVARHATSEGGQEYLRYWTLFQHQSGQCVFTLKKALDESNGEVPYKVILVLKGYVLPCRGYGNVTVDEAIPELAAKFGINVRKAPYKP